MLDELIVGLRPIRRDLWKWWQNKGIPLLIIYLAILHVPWIINLVFVQTQLRSWGIPGQGALINLIISLSISLRPLLFGLIWFLAAQCALRAFKQMEELPLPSKWMLMRLRLSYSLIQGIPLILAGALFHFLTELARDLFDYYPAPFAPLSEYFPVCCWFIILAAFYYPGRIHALAFFGFSMLTPVIMTFYRGRDINELHPASKLRDYMIYTDTNLSVPGLLISLILVLVLLYALTRKIDIGGKLAYSVLLFSTIVYFNAGLVPSRATSFNFEAHAGMTRFQIASICTSLVEFPVAYYPNEIKQDTGIWIVNKFIHVEPSNTWIWVVFALNSLWFMLLILAIYQLVLREWPRFAWVRGEPSDNQPGHQSLDDWLREDDDPEDPAGSAD